MKIHFKTKYYNKLVKLNLIETKIYKKKYGLQNLKIEDIEHKIKNSVLIIWKYHMKSKRILFIFNWFTRQTYSIKSFFWKTWHIFIFESYFSVGLFFNYKMLQLRSKFELVVVVGVLINQIFIKEFQKLNKPIIFIGNGSETFLNLFDYVIPGIFLDKTKKIKDNFFFELIILILQTKKVWKL